MNHIHQRIIEVDCTRECISVNSIVGVFFHYIRDKTKNNFILNIEKFEETARLELLYLYIFFIVVTQLILNDIYRLR